MGPHVRSHITSHTVSPSTQNFLLILKQSTMSVFLLCVRIVSLVVLVSTPPLVVGPCGTLTSVLCAVPPRPSSTLTSPTSQVSTLEPTFRFRVDSSDNIRPFHLTRPGPTTVVRTNTGRVLFQTNVRFV